VVYAKRPFRGPEHVLHYLARYTHRVAISNHGIVNLADGKVTFRWKDYAHKSKQRLMTVTAEEFFVGSCFIPCLAALCASVSAASSPTGAAANSYHSADAC
jgi:hypothetical protein